MEADTTWDEGVDVVVVGSGGGITGAYTAAREGLTVALVEATDTFGGTTAYSGGGGMWFPCNPVLRRAGSDDTIDDALAYFHAVVDARVLDTEGRPIPGLYAAGNTMVGVSGTTYPGGANPIGASMSFSHLAALHMAGRSARR